MGARSHPASHVMTMPDGSTMDAAAMPCHDPAVDKSGCGACCGPIAAEPALQAQLFDRAAASADATQSARLANPVFVFERLAGASATEVTRALGVSLLNLLPLPARAAQADATQQRLRLAADVLRGAPAARAAWVDAVAAEQSARYAAQVLDAAEAGALLARRPEAAGNFSALQRAREEACVSDASTGLAQARHDELARTLGLARVTGTPDALDVGAERHDRTGQPREHGLTLSVPLPLFDTGDATREAARARYDAALARSAAQGVAAASQLRQQVPAALQRHAREPVRRAPRRERAQDVHDDRIQPPVVEQPHLFRHRAAGGAPARAGAHPRGQPVDDQPPHPPARPRDAGHRHGRRPHAARLALARGDGGHRGGPDAPAGVRGRGRGRLVAAVPQVAPHEERDEP